jgi:ABC-type Zn uptake system ZnuABC Zn-binding protein ZnuA
MNRAALALLLACSTLAGGAGPARLRVAATTDIVGDVVAAVGGNEIDLRVLLSAGADPHGFDPAPRDLARLSTARILFVNGGGLEAFLGRARAALPPAARVVEVSEGVSFRAMDACEGHGHEDGHRHAGGVDPHVWLDPLNVKVWACNIARALADAEPAYASVFNSRAAAYVERLEELDTWIRQEVGRIPAESRLLAADHRVLGYFAARYGFRDLGAVTASFSTLAEPTPREVATLMDGLRDHGVQVIFAGEGPPAALCHRVAADAGARLVQLHCGSLTGPGGERPGYIEMMRHNVSAIVEALSP